jgi:phytoene dehydrogenase-like protein
MTMSYDAIVIGAGANGLVAAATLGKAGRRVLLLERENERGGQSRTVEVATGFRAPLGPDAGWMPPTVARLVGLDSSAMVAPEVSVTASDEDGSFFVLPRETSHAQEALRARSPRDATRWPEFVETLGKLAGFLQALYQAPAPRIDARSIGELLPLLGLGRKLRSLGHDDMIELLRVMPMPVQDLVDDAFEMPLLKAAIAAGGVQGIRQGPRSGGTAFVLLHHLVGAPEGSIRARSWWRDGPDVFAVAAEAAAKRRGVVIRSGANVARILVRDEVVAGVALHGGEEILAPVVVSTVDATRTLLGLVDPVWLDPDFVHAVRNIKYRGSTAVVHYALDRLPELAGVSDAPSALAGVVSLTSSMDALERAYDAAKYGVMSSEPHVEITVPSVRWPSLAPSGKHVLTATVRYAPYRLREEAAWDSTRACTLADNVTAAIARVIPRFAGSVLHHAVLTPRDIEARFGATEGALTQGELTLDQILFMRPVPGWGRHAMPIDGLYLGGAGTHPGPGVLGGSGLLAAKRVLADRKK